LKDSIYYRTIPTIGTRVWDLISSGNYWEEFPNYWNNQYHRSDNNSSDYCPETTEKNINLSKSFFEQLDSLGCKLHEEFTTATQSSKNSFDVI
jgi:hypothetical protein